MWTKEQGPGPGSGAHQVPCGCQEKMVAGEQRARRSVLEAGPGLAEFRVKDSSNGLPLPKTYLRLPIRLEQQYPGGGTLS